MTLTATDELFVSPRAERVSWVRVLDVDPDLASGLDETQRRIAARVALGRVVTHATGPWQLTSAPDRSCLGLLIVDGFIVITIDVADRTHVELLGPGDIISPWVDVEDELLSPSLVTASVLSDLQLAFLGREFALQAARWPEIQAALMRRLITRARRLSLQAAINAVQRIDERLELTLWHLAHRFAKVTPSGVCLSLPLTQAQWACMISAQRPSVTLALAALERREHLTRRGRHEWILHGQAPQRFEELARKSRVMA